MGALAPHGQVPSRRFPTLAARSEPNAPTGALMSSSSTFCSIGGPASWIALQQPGLNLLFPVTLETNVPAQREADEDPEVPARGPHLLWRGRRGIAGPARPVGRPRSDEALQDRPPDRLPPPCASSSPGPILLPEVVNPCGLCRRNCRHSRPLWCHTTSSQVAIRSSLLPISSLLTISHENTAP